MKDRFNTFDSFDESDASFDDFEQAIPLMSEEEEKELTESVIPDELPILPLKIQSCFQELWFQLPLAETVRLH